MTKKITILSGICLTAALSISSAFAEMRGTLRVTIPSNVTASGLSLPAGAYSIQELRGSGVNKVLLLQSASGVSINVLTEPIRKAQESTVEGSSITLHQVGGHLRLDEVWLAGSEVGYRILSLGN